MTDRSQPGRDSQSESDFHEFSQGANPTHDPQETGTFSLHRPQPANPARVAPPAEPPQAFGRYQVLGFLAKGSFGAVYLAEDAQLRRKVAVKVPHRHIVGNQAEQFLQEARRLAQLKHPGVVAVYDVGVEAGRSYIVSDFVTGISLKDWLKGNQPTWEQTASIVAAVADALGHAHLHGVIHRDVKPSNIVLTEGTRPILLDFGLALSELEAMGRTETAMGTPAYMSPEQARGEAYRIDGRTDIFSLGVILYEMLCGRRPFYAPDVYELMRQVREDAPRPPRQINPNIPRELERICLKAMANRLVDRYTTAGDVAADLRLALTPAAVVPTVDPSDRTATQQACPKCQRPSSPGARVCMGCGETLSRPEPAAAASLPATEIGLGSSREAERRQVTILYCGNNLGESVELLEALDPEEQHALTERCRQTCHEAAARYQGAVLTSAGQGTLICFGFPVTFEDATRRAIHAGLSILKALAKIGDEIHQRRGLHLSAWAAIHTGPAICEESGGSSGKALSVVGEAPNVATRLEPFTEGGALVISEAAHRLVEGFFVSQSLGKQNVKGLTQPTEIFRVVRSSGAAGRMDAAGAAGLTPLIGRDQEAGLLNDRWERAREGQGQSVLLAGEAGIGKSRLVHVLKERVREETKGEGRPIVEWRCSPYHQNSGLYPVIDYFERLHRLRGDDAPGERLNKLIAALQSLGLDGPETTPLFAAMLSIPPDEQHPPPALTPQRIKERTLEVLLDWIHAYADKHPTLFIIEDLHWIDATTLEFLGLLLAQVEADKLLIVLTARPEFTPSWTGGAHLTQMALNRLTRGQIAEMVRRKTGLTTVPQELVDQIANRTDGVPLFVEEFTKMMLEAGAFREGSSDGSASGSFQVQAIPATLQDLLLARLDRMGSVRDVVQVASAIGREFPFAMLRAVSPLEEADLRRELTKLIQAEILFAKGRPPQSSYLFKHALIQDAAYQSLLKPRRREFHRLIAQALVQQFPEKAEREPELLARHYTEAGLPREAITYWEKAAQRAQEKSSIVESMGHAAAGLALLPELAESPEKDLQEFRLQLLFGVGVMAVEGYGSPRLPSIHGRARDLCIKLGAKEHLFQVLWGIWAWSFIRDELEFGAGLAREMTQLAATLKDAGYRMEAHFAVGCNAFYRGDFAESLGQCDAGIALHTPDLGRLHSRYTGQNSGVTNRCYNACSLWHLGYPDKAAARIREMLALAEELKHPFSLVFGLYHDAFLKQQYRRGEEAKQAGETLRTAALQHGFPFWAALGTLSRGTGLMQLGSYAEAVEALREGLAALSATGAGIVIPYYTGRLAETYLGAGRFAEAAGTLDETFALAEKCKELFAEAEWRRLQGELALARSDDKVTAESCFRRAMETARRQGARSLELRAATSLARLLQGQGRIPDARQALAPVYKWFTQGFDTVDLVDAAKIIGALEAK